jgi:hypothetical protein
MSLTACASTAPPPPHLYSGEWEFHFETSSFVTDDGEGPYWLVGDEVWPRLTAPLNEAGGPWGRLHIVVEGELSEPGRYGHMGAYSRQLRVTRVIETTQASSQP